MKNILFIITKSCVGGAQIFVSDQATLLKKYRFNIFLVTNEEGWLTKKTNSIINSMLLDKNIEKLYSFYFLYKLIIFIKKNNIDLIVCNSANAGLYGRLGAFVTKKKSIYVSHGWSSIYNGGQISFIYNFIELFLSLISNKILCISENDYNIAIDKIKIKKNKCFLIPNNIYPPKSLKKIINSKFNNNSIICVCRLAYPKLPKLLIDSIIDLKDYNLTIIGGGPQFEELNNYILFNKINNVFLLGEIQDFHNFQNYDIFCLISESEGLPMAAIEAMAYGLPLVLSNVGGCPELIEDNGYFVSNNIIDIQQAIELCSLNLNDFSINSIDLFNKKYNLLNNSKTYIDFYNSIINRNYNKQ